MVKNKPKSQVIRIRTTLIERLREVDDDVNEAISKLLDEMGYPEHRIKYITRQEARRITTEIIEAKIAKLHKKNRY